jgi:hypothetical protein
MKCHNKQQQLPQLLIICLVGIVGKLFLQIALEIIIASLLLRQQQLLQWRLVKFKAAVEASLLSIQGQLQQQQQLLQRLRII